MRRKDCDLSRYITHNRLISVLAFTGGFIDASGYILLNRIYTSSSTTGNIITAGVSVYDNPRQALVRLIVLVAFGLGVFMVATLGFQAPPASSLYSRQIQSKFLLLEAIVLLAAAAVCLASHNVGANPPPWLQPHAGAMLSFAMGMQSTTLITITSETNKSIPVTDFTGNFVATVVESTEALCFYLASVGYMSLCRPNRGKLKDHDALVAKYIHDRMTRCKPRCYALISFTVGAAVATPLAYTIQFWCISIPIVILVLTAAFVATISRQARQFELTMDPEVLQKAHNFCMTTDYMIRTTNMQSSYTATADSLLKGKIIDTLEENQLNCRTYSTSSSV